jgi:hypothetical protein
MKMKLHLFMFSLLGLGLINGCASCRRSSSTPPPSLQEKDSVPLLAAKQEMKSRGQSLHERLDYQVVAKDWGWIVIVGNLSGRQPKGQAYIPGDAVLMRIDKEGKVFEYHHLP